MRVVYKIDDAHLKSGVPGNEGKTFFLSAEGVSLA